MELFNGSYCSLILALLGNSFRRKYLQVIKHIQRVEILRDSTQLRRIHRARGHVSPLLQMAGRGGTVSKRTANKKLTNCTARHKSAHQND